MHVPHVSADYVAEDKELCSLTELNCTDAQSWYEINQNSA